MAETEKKYFLNKKAKAKSTVHFGRFGAKIDLDTATQDDLKFLYEVKKHPWVSKK